MALTRPNIASFKSLEDYNVSETNNFIIINNKKENESISIRKQSIEFIGIKSNDLTFTQYVISTTSGHEYSFKFDNLWVYTNDEIQRILKSL